jgi:hypothetical protein
MKSLGGGIFIQKDCRNEERLVESTSLPAPFKEGIAKCHSMKPFANL